MALLRTHLQRLFELFSPGASIDDAVIAERRQPLESDISGRHILDVSDLASAPDYEVRFDDLLA